MVDSSVTALSDRLADLEHTVQSRMTTPVTDTSATHVSLEALATIEQALMSELGKAKDENTQSMSRLFDLLEGFSEKQKSLEKQLTGLRSFAWHVEQFLAQYTGEGAPAPSETSIATIQGLTARGQLYLRDMFPEPLVRLPDHLHIFRFLDHHLLYPHHQFLRRNALPSEPSRVSTTHFSTARSEVRSGAIRIDITNPEQWSAGETAILRNQEAKQVRDIGGSLIFETPVQHDYEAGVEVRSLLSTERLEEMDGRLAVTDEDPHTPGARYVPFWVAEAPNQSRRKWEPR